MKEFEFIDRVMPDVPPLSPAQLAAARARLAAAGAARAAGPARGRRPAAYGWRGIALAAMAVVVVIGVVAFLAPSAGRKPVASTPGQLLNAAADKLAAQPQGSGRYWRLETEQVIRTKSPQGFLVEERSKDVLILGRNHDAYNWYEPVSARPYDAAAAEAWKRAGSPKLCPAPDCDPKLRFYPQRTLKRSLRLAPGWQPTLEELLALPREANALRTEALKHVPIGYDKGPDGWVQEAGLRLVADVPATPGTRAAAYRMLAALPGARVVDDVRDPLGRRGVTLQLPVNDVIRAQLVIDPGSGGLWAVQLVAPQPGLPQGLPAQASIIVRTGWSDARPVPPPGCRGCQGRY
ncbi:CU044_5270 family protein [Nonomuraea sp. NPDC050451]|uniref:CU044_5270 family protein n=1 Tax=Nonomuraea sp. NPDC050451 TaxID=3364364 RepID=UPI0037A671FA